MNTLQPGISAMKEKFDKGMTNITIWGMISWCKRHLNCPFLIPLRILQ